MLVTSMSTKIIHGYWWNKLNETSEVLWTTNFWSNRQMRSYIGITVHFIWNEKLHNAMLRLQTIQRPSHSWQHRNQQFERNDSNFEITVAGQY